MALDRCISALFFGHLLTTNGCVRKSLHGPDMCDQKAIRVANITGNQLGVCDRNKKIEPFGPDSVLANLLPINMCGINTAGFKLDISSKSNCFVLKGCVILTIDTANSKKRDWLGGRFWIKKAIFIDYILG